MEDLGRRGGWMVREGEEMRGVVERLRLWGKAVKQEEKEGSE